MTVHELDVLLRGILIGTNIVAAGIGIFRFRQLPLGLRYLALAAVFDMLMELILTALIKVVHLKSNLFMMPFIVMGEVVLLALAYREALQSALFNRYMPWVVGLFSAYALADGWMGRGVVQHAIGPEIIADLLLLSLVGFYFWKLLQELHVESLRHDSFFVMSVGLLLFLLGDLLISLFSNYLLAHYSHQLQVIVMLLIHYVFVITLNCGYCLALWMFPRKENSFSY